jgi:pantoate--beta-alanine ligase
MPAPQMIHGCREMQETILQLRRAGKRIGLVPTMGALHAGHVSLVARAKLACDVTVATIFVNPTQFGPREDFSKYPRTLAEDAARLSEVGCDYVFAPSAEEMYPPGFSTYVEPPAVAQPLEGLFRPTHFRGVCTVVLKLFELVPSDVAYFGQKDFQQALVIQHMVRDFHLPVQIEVCPIIREADGLAMSSRNRYLNSGERTQALGLSRALQAARLAFQQGETCGETLRSLLRNTLEQDGITRIDYATVADCTNLSEPATVQSPAVALIACHVGTTRLIDNEIW